MKVVRELGTGVGFEELKGIYENGNKIAISFDENTSLSCIETFLDSSDMSIDEDNYSELKFLEGFGFTEELSEVGVFAENVVVVSEIMEDKVGYLGVIAPFTGEYSGFTSTFHLYNEAKSDFNSDVFYIADRVFEVEA